MAKIFPDARKSKHARPTFIVKFTPLPGTDSIKSLRWLLKVALRRFGLKCPPRRAERRRRRDQRGRGMSVLATALAFAARGHAVLPLWWPVGTDKLVCACGRLCGKAAAKHPHGRHAPRGLHSATCDSGIIKHGSGIRRRTPTSAWSPTSSSSSISTRAAMATTVSTRSSGRMATCRQHGA